MHNNNRQPAQTVSQPTRFVQLFGWPWQGADRISKLDFLNFEIFIVLLVFLQYSTPISIFRHQINRYLNTFQVVWRLEFKIKIPKREETTYTVVLVRPKTGKSAQLSFAPKFLGEILSIWANFVQCPSQKFADLGENRPNRQNFAQKILGRNLTAWIRPFRTSFAKKKITV
jgi:hypothetical protein